MFGVMIPFLMYLHSIRESTFIANVNTLSSCTKRKDIHDPSKGCERYFIVRVTLHNDGPKRSTIYNSEIILENGNSELQLQNLGMFSKGDAYNEFTHSEINVVRKWVSDLVKNGSWNKFDPSEDPSIRRRRVLLRDFMTTDFLPLSIDAHDCDSFDLLLFVLPEDEDDYEKNMSKNARFVVRVRKYYKPIWFIPFIRWIRWIRLSRISDVFDPILRRGQ